MSKPRTRIVRPFGLLGGSYEVGNSGVWQHRLAGLVAIAAIGLSLFDEQLGAPDRFGSWALVVGFLLCLALCLNVARSGRRI